MNIFYAVQANGNGHFSRAIQILPYLQKYGNVDIFLSGNNTQLQHTIPIKYRSKGVNLLYKNNGGLDYIETFKSIPMQLLINEARALPLKDYDLILNDFEFVTSLACNIQKKDSIHFGHQASFQSKLTPRSKSYNPFGKFVLQNLIKSTKYMGLHFKAYDKHIYNPIIKDVIINAIPTNEGHITVYLPQYSKSILEPYLLQCKRTRFEVFTKEQSKKTSLDNISYFPISNENFTNSLIKSNGIISSGGFETPAEAMYLEKKLLCIPIKNHFEQECNAEALSRLGVKVIQKIDSEFTQVLNKWLVDDKIISLKLKHSTEELIDTLMNKVAKNELIMA